jgi:ubiquinone/menaquinone biosynthesis C-methylase UbiE
LSQKEAFLNGEANAWFERNKNGGDGLSDPVVSAIQRLNIHAKSVLEIGCSTGTRLERLRETLHAECHGIEPSDKAVRHGMAKNPLLHLLQGSADHLPYEDNRFELVIFGFCLYLCDPSEYFAIAREADRVLRDKGCLVILDFTSPIPYVVPYSHRPGIYSHKLNWSGMFTWHPAYRLLAREYTEHSEQRSFHPNERITVDILRKDSSIAFVSEPYQKKTTGLQYSRKIPK